MTKAVIVPRVQLKSPPHFVHDQTRESWELVEDVDFIGNENLELVQLLEGIEEFLSSDILLERSKKESRAGQRHAERLLLQQQDIPKEWRAFWLIFPGTVWRNANNISFMPYMRWAGRRKGWIFGFDWLDSSLIFNASIRLVRICSGSVSDL